MTKTQTPTKNHLADSHLSDKRNGEDSDNGNNCMRKNVLW